jgi:hypothetical protein
MVDKEEVLSDLETVESEVRFSQHSHRRARQRNVDLDAVRQRLRDLDVVSVRGNDDDDPRYGRTYKVVVEGSGENLYEMPVYFNMNGSEIYVKSVWNK